MTRAQHEQARRELGFVEEYNMYANGDFDRMVSESHRNDEMQIQEDDNFYWGCHDKP